MYNVLFKFVQKQLFICFIIYIILVEKANILSLENKNHILVSLFCISFYVFIGCIYNFKMMFDRSTERFIYLLNHKHNGLACKYKHKTHLNVEETEH